MWLEDSSGHIKEIQVSPSDMDQDPYWVNCVGPKPINKEVQSQSEQCCTVVLPFTAQEHMYLCSHAPAELSHDYTTTARSNFFICTFFSCHLFQFNILLALIPLGNFLSWPPANFEVSSPFQSMNWTKQNLSYQLKSIAVEAPLPKEVHYKGLSYRDL